MCSCRFLLLDSCFRHQSTFLHCSHVRSGLSISPIVYSKLPFFKVSSHTQLLGVPEVIPFRTYSSGKPYRTWHRQMYLPPLHSQWGWEISTGHVSNIPSTTTTENSTVHAFVTTSAFQRWKAIFVPFCWNAVIPGYLVSPIRKPIYSLSCWTLVADSTQVLSYHLSELKLLFAFFSRFWFNL